MAPLRGKNEKVDCVLPSLFPSNAPSCRDGRHIFSNSKNSNSTLHPLCERCQSDLVDWDRVRRRDIKDTEHTFSQLKLDAFRFEFWTREFDQKAKSHAQKKGLDGLKEGVRRRLQTSVGEVHIMKDGSRRPYRDGYQTPYAGNSIYYAQHALACCCRRCIALWHGIPNGRDLTSEELDYFVHLMMLFLKKRIPELDGRERK